MSDATASATVERPGRLKEFWFYFRENRGAVFGLWVFAVFLLVAIFAPVIAPHDPSTQFRDHLLQPPVWQTWGDWSFILGTDALGRDLLSRLLNGARYSFFVGIVVVVIAASGGITVGLLAGFAPKWLDMIVMRIMDVILAFPSLLLARGRALLPRLVHHKEAPRPAHLRSGKAASLGGVHRLQHIGGERADGLVDGTDRRAIARQHRMGPFQDGQACHPGQALAFSRLSLIILRVMSWRRSGVI